MSDLKQVLDSYRDPAAARKLADVLRALDGEQVSMMEVCGTHTMSIFRYGIRSLLPQSIRLVSGPGCPVCVTPTDYMDAALWLARQENVIITTFGDLMKVPGSASSLSAEKSSGADIRIVYSPLDAVAIASQNRGRKVVFLSVGFETTAPICALAVLKAKEEGLNNFMLLSANKTMPGAIRLIAGDEKSGIGGFLYPGNVAAITGTAGFEEVAGEYGIPGVVTGFEPLDILHAVITLTGLIREGSNKVENEYKRIVRSEGNPLAVSKLYEVFEPCGSQWRGLGSIPGSGLRIREEYSDFDAQKVFDIPATVGKEPAGCLCPQVLTGRATPDKCKHFGKTCTPESPVGACMVSSEGTCAAYYRFGRNS
jgi:hydrogenase expression/formation protein HypD